MDFVTIITWIYAGLFGYFAAGLVVCLLVDRVDARAWADPATYRPCVTTLFLIVWPIAGAWVAWQVLSHAMRQRPEW